MRNPSPTTQSQSGLGRLIRLIGRFFAVKSAALNSTWGGRAIAAACIIIGLGFTAWICGFKVLDRDFWWHIKAGQIMVQEHRWITIEPFAYTRAGLPYLATHEWLAQVVLYLVHAAGGTTGIIVFRTFMIALVAFFLLAIDRKRIWPNLLLIVYMLNVARPGFMDRPQLFTFAILAAFLYLAFHILDDENASVAEGWPKTEKLLWLFVPLEILWVNTHGAAALLGLGIVGAILAQRIVSWIAAPHHDRHARARGIWRLVAVCATLAVCLLASPALWGNITYLNSLLHDKTVAFINEWQPRALGLYLTDYALLWGVSLLALFASRKKFVFSALVLAATGYLSRQALRHEMLFAFTAVGVTIYQLRHLAHYHQALAWLKGRPILFVLATGIPLAALVWYTKVEYKNFATRDQLYGYGTFDLARGAADFVERENLQGNMFNTYGIGGYLLYRGYPNRKVYIDGRNVDYGFDFMAKTYAAQEDLAAWQSLEKTYGLTYALIDYDAIRENGQYPFADHLDKNPGWKLVYLDDWVGVYLKDTKENAPIIARDAITRVTPQSLTENTASDLANDLSLPGIETELKRIAHDNPDGVKADIALAKLYVREKKFDLAEASLQSALHTQPHRPEIHQQFAETYAAEERWADAAREMVQAINDADQASPNVYARTAELFNKAGNAAEAARYRKKAGGADASVMPAIPQMPGMPQMPTPAGTKQDAATQAQAQDLLSQLQEDSDKADKLVDQGVDAAQAGRLTEAEDDFNKALKLNPHNAAAMNDLGALYQQQRKYDEAVKWYRKALSEKKDYSDAEYNISTALYILHVYDEAMTHAKRAQDLGRDATAIITAIEKAQAAP